MAILAIVAVTYGRYSFIQSESWMDARQVIKTSDRIKIDIGEVKEISAHYFPFSYSYAGGNASLEITVDIKGEYKSKTFDLKMKRRDFKWSIVKVE